MSHIVPESSYSKARASLGVRTTGRCCEVKNKAPRLVRIGLFIANTVMHHPDPGANLVQELGRGAGSCLAIFHPKNFRLS